METAPALEAILTSYPEWVTIGSLPLDEEEDQIDLAAKLIECNVLAIKD
jgi:hypothetical protein